MRPGGRLIACGILVRVTRWLQGRLAGPRLLADPGMPSARSSALVAIERDRRLAARGLGYPADQILGRCSRVAEKHARNQVEQDGLQAASKQSVVCDMLVKLDQPLRR